METEAGVSEIEALDAGAKEASKAAGRPGGK